ncbi:hypothetical protein ACP275_13G036400 [Erythranthe tilingii]
MTSEAISIGSTTQNPSSDGSNPPPKKKRNLPGTPDPEAEVIALSPKTLMATNRFLCEICGKGFQRDQNLQLHRRGHNLPWKLKQRSTKEVRKRVYVCPEKTCVHNHPSRALGDLTGIKKHFCRKHGEKKWKCDKCSKRYAVHSDWKAHSKTCGTREYKCDCGTIFSRRDSFITHRAFCDALAEETARFMAASQNITNHIAPNNNINYHFIGSSSLGHHYPSTGPLFPTGRGSLPLWMAQCPPRVEDSTPKNHQEMHHHPMGVPFTFGALDNNNFSNFDPLVNNNPSSSNYHLNWDLANNPIPLSNAREVSAPSLFSTQNHHQQSNATISATALLQKAAQIGATTTTTTTTTQDHHPSLILGSFGGENSNNMVVQEDHGNKFCGLYGTSSAATSGGGLGNSDVESSVVNDFSPLNQMEINYLSKRRRLLSSDEGETRDFLGVGVQSICHPSSMNGWM